MFELDCSVRNCHQPLQRRENGLVCASGHLFDRAKEGYWNLLQPQDRRSRNPGDPDQAVLARHRHLARGFATGLIDALKPWVSLSDSAGTTSPPRTLDLGCGEGSFGPALFSADAANYCGIDLSKRAIKLAARRWPEATWVLANADRGLPVASSSVQRIVSLFGRRNGPEIRRLLTTDGIFIVAVPGEDDLIELREQVQQTGLRRSRWEMVVDEMASVGFVCQQHLHWQQQVRMEPDALSDAMAMTYRAQRHSQQIRLETLDAMIVTLAADLVLFRPQQ